MSRASSGGGLRSGNLARWVPAIAWLGSYEKRFLAGDLAGGLTASAVVIPQAVIRHTRVLDV